MKLELSCCQVLSECPPDLGGGLMADPAVTPTTSARAAHDYQRNGTRDPFAALEIATGTVITDIRAQPTSADFVAFLNKINREVPNARPALTGVFVGISPLGDRAVTGEVRRGRCLITRRR